MWRTLPPANNSAKRTPAAPPPGGLPRLRRTANTGHRQRVGAGPGEGTRGKNVAEVRRTRVRSRVSTCGFPVSVSYMACHLVAMAVQYLPAREARDGIDTFVAASGDARLFAHVSVRSGTLPCEFQWSMIS
eukprot:2544123-Prymnesium_polylepis.2